MIRLTTIRIEIASFALHSAHSHTFAGWTCTASTSALLWRHIHRMKKRILNEIFHVGTSLKSRSTVWWILTRLSTIYVHMKFQARKSSCDLNSALRCITHSCHSKKLHFILNWKHQVKCDGISFVFLYYAHITMHRLYLKALFTAWALQITTQVLLFVPIKCLFRNLKSCGKKFVQKKD